MNQFRPRRLAGQTNKGANWLGTAQTALDYETDSPPRKVLRARFQFYWVSSLSEPGWGVLGPYVALPFTGHGSASRFSVGELALTMMELLRWKHVWFYGVGGFRGQSLCLNLLLAKRKPRVWVLPARGL